MNAKRVLIAEDDFMLSLINKKYVELIGHKVVACVTNGEDAIAAVKEHSPDIILMDLHLKGSTDGITAMLEIAKFSQVPVVYLSGDSFEDHKERIAQTNMLAFCMKPIRLEQLREFISQI
jgi:CheY-like chemotaxis protein